jgi:hypothetical protein
MAKRGDKGKRDDPESTIKIRDPEDSIVSRIFETIRKANPRLIAGCVAAFAAVAIAVIVFSGGGGSDDSSASSSSTSTTGDVTSASGHHFAVIRSTDSSWVRGQASLVSLDAFATVDGRAEALGATYQSLRDREVARQERLAELRRERAQSAARRRALAAYRAALRRAAAERRRQQRELAERRRRLKEKLKRLREKYKVEPGEECSIPEVQQQFDCSTGYPF